MYNKLVYYTLASFIFIQLFFLLAGSVLAQEYVLPYPSFMPGHPFYKVQKILDKIQEFYSFGNFSKFHYSLKLADRKLVEAKTLFEYKQYLLAVNALKASDEYFKRVPVCLLSAKQEGKNIQEKSGLLKQAAIKHQDVLQKLMLEVPAEFKWQPEKEEETVIKIKSTIEESIKIRRNRG